MIYIIIGLMLLAILFLGKDTVGQDSSGQPSPQPPPQSPVAPPDIQNPDAGLSPGFAGEYVISQVIWAENPNVSSEDRAIIAQKLVNFSRTAGFDPLLVAAVCRQESNFRKTAKGSAGEYGLMQVTPMAYSEVLKRNPGLPNYPLNYLLQIGWNLQIGTLYLKWCLERAKTDLKQLASRPEFKGQLIRAALYMYNAGFRAGNPRGIQYQNEVMEHYKRFQERFANFSSGGGGIGGGGGTAD